MYVYIYTHIYIYIYNCVYIYIYISHDGFGVLVSATFLLFPNHASAHDLTHPLLGGKKHASDSQSGASVGPLGKRSRRRRSGLRCPLPRELRA